MPIVNIIKRASSYILGTDDVEEIDDLIYEDNEVLFCKNNICVHPPAFARQESDILHYPGYLTVTTKTFIDQYNNAKRPTLLLTWIPNATLRKCPSTIENSVTTAPAIVHRQLSIDDHHLNLKSNKLLNNAINERNGIKNGSATSLISNNTNPFLEPYYYGPSSVAEKKLTNGGGGVDNLDEISVSSSSDKASSITNSVSTQSCCREDAQSHNEDEDVFITLTSELTASIKEETEEELVLKTELQPLLQDELTKNDVNAAKNLRTLMAQHSVTSVNITIANPCIQNHDISPTESVHQQNETFSGRTTSVSSTDDISPNWMTPELFAYKHNLSFPDSATASPIVTRKAQLKCRR